MTRDADTNEKVLLLRSLIVAAKNTSESMNTFVHWMLGGFGAGLTFLLGNLDGLKGHVVDGSIERAGGIFLWAALLGIAQTYIAMVVRAAVGVFQEVEKLVQPDSNLSLYRFFSVYIQGVPVYLRLVAAWAAKNFVEGNITRTGRYIYNAVVIQCLLGVVVTVRLVWALKVIIDGLK